MGAGTRDPHPSRAPPRGGAQPKGGTARGGLILVSRPPPRTRSLRPGTIDGELPIAMATFAALRAHGAGLTRLGWRMINLASWLLRLARKSRPATIGRGRGVGWRALMPPRRRAGCAGGRRLRGDYGLITLALRVVRITPERDLATTADESPNPGHGGPGDAGVFNRSTSPSQPRRWPCAGRAPAVATRLTGVLRAIRADDQVPRWPQARPALQGGGLGGQRGDPAWPARSGH